MITFGVFRAIQNGFFDLDGEIGEHNETTLTDYIAKLPLTVEDMLDVQYDGYIKERRSDESLLLGQFVMRQHPRYDAEHFQMPVLEYTITEVKLPFLYDLCKNSLLNAKKDKIADGQVDFYEHYESIDPALWNAEEAYRLYWSYGHFVDRYLLCYEKRIVEITFDWEPTTEQMAISAERLSGE